MKHSFTLTASLLLGLGSLSAQIESAPLGIQSGAPSPLSFLNSEQTKDLTLCTYEICRPNDKGDLEILPIAAGSVSSLLAQASEPGSKDFLVFYPNDRLREPDSRLILRHRYLIKVAEDADLSAIQDRCGIKSLKPLRPGSKLVVCTEESSGKVLSQLGRILADPQIESVEPLFAKKRFKRIVPTDPFYDLADRPDGFDDNSTTYQWYLNNVGANGGLTDIDIGFEEATNTATGNGVVVAIIDDGFAVDHEDIAANVTGPHLNIIESTDDLVSEEPATLDPLLNHGTNVAGILGAVANNDLGISGAAPDASLSSIVLLGAPFDDADEGAALGFSPDGIDIYNSSWGPDDTVFDLEGPGTAASDALENGVTNGRMVDGTALGNIYVWAAGNGGLIGDNSNSDGYANSRFTIAVGAVSDNGVKARFSEKGSNLVVSAPSGGGSQDMVTTSFSVEENEDGELVRISEYVSDFSGTSAATPLVSATVALLLDENPDLTWRDVQDVLIRSARKIDGNNGGWADNGAGLHFSHSYGAGLINADEAVKMVAGTSVIPWEPLGPATSQRKGRLYSDLEGQESGEIPDGNGTSFLSEFDFSVDNDGNPAENLLVEHVELRVNIDTRSRSDLEIVVISPSGTQSILQDASFENDEQSIVNWTFMTTHNWGEGSAGKWLVRVTDLTTGNEARFDNVFLTIHGSPDPDAPILTGPVLTSTRTVLTDQGRMLDYSLQTSLGVTDAEVGDLPDGLVYDPTRREITGIPTIPGLYQVPVTLTDEDGLTNELTISFIIRPTSVALGDAIGFSGIPAIFDGDLPWDFDFNDSNDAPTVPQEERQSVTSSIDLVNNQTSTFGFDGLGEGVLLWDWKVSSEEGFDRLWFNRAQGSVPQFWDGFISGSKDWGRAAVMLPDASNSVRWTFTKDDRISVGEDRGLVDNLEFVSTEKYLDEVRRAGNIKGFDFELPSRMLFIPIELNGASPPDDGGPGSTLITPAIGNGQSASLAGWVEGPGVFSFAAFNYAEVDDVLEFILDGVVVSSNPGVGQTGGDLVRIDVNQAINAGRHRIEIRFRKNFSGSDAADFGGVTFDGVLLDEVVFTPDAGDGELSDSQSSSLDTDGDGYNNHLETSFGGDWKVPDVPRYLPQVVTSGGQTYIEYGIDTLRTDLNYIPQQSGDLETWVDASLQSLVRVEGSVEVYRIPVQSVPGRRNLFYRVIAEDKFAR